MSISNEEYINEAISTLNIKLKTEMTEEMCTLDHAIKGIASEGGELLTHLKAVMYYGKTLDKVNIYEELGDVLWFIAVICNLYGWKFENIMEDNIEKLKKRYPTGFDVLHAENRDKENELKHIERKDKRDLNVCIGDDCKVPPTIFSDAGKFWYSCPTCMKGAPDGRDEDEAAIHWNLANTEN